VLPEEAELDPLSQASLADADRGTMRNIEIIQELSEREPAGKPKRLILRFLVSPTELIGNEAGEVVAMRMAKNELYQTDSGTLRSRTTDQVEEIPLAWCSARLATWAFRCPDVPFHERWGVILNEKGRVLNPEQQRAGAGRIHGGLDQAWPQRSHWHQQAGCGRNGRMYAGRCCRR
jgi:ferredoxin--NADP+ reductase